MATTITGVKTVKRRRTHPRENFYTGQSNMDWMMKEIEFYTTCPELDRERVAVFLAPISLGDMAGVCYTGGKVTAIDHEAQTITLAYTTNRNMITPIVVTLTQDDIWKGVWTGFADHMYFANGDLVGMSSEADSKIRVHMENTPENIEKLRQGGFEIVEEEAAK